MAFYTGYVNLPTSTYAAWRAAVLGNGYDADLQNGDQCWDLAAEFWWNVGFPQGYPLTGSNHAAYECWLDHKDDNASYNGVQYFDLITDKTQIKRGDVVVLDEHGSYVYGHIAFADEDYHGSYLLLLGQNQGTGGTPTPVVNPDGGTTANVKSLSINTFLGAFRYKAWHEIPPTPTTSNNHFKWVLYARKLREKRSGL